MCIYWSEEAQVCLSMQRLPALVLLCWETHALRNGISVVSCLATIELSHPSSYKRLDAWTWSHTPPQPWAPCTDTGAEKTHNLPLLTNRSSNGYTHMQGSITLMCTTAVTFDCKGICKVQSLFFFLKFFSCGLYERCFRKVLSNAFISFTDKLLILHKEWEMS